MPSWTSEQMDAIHLSGKNIIVSAGAGSGKTAVLTERVITKLLNGDSIKNLLILTFTNAAAGEMKDRIRSAIKKQSSLKDQLNYIDNAYITTFDSFSLSIVKKYHYLLNITSSPKIVDSALLSIKKKEILDQTFNELYESNNEVFLNLINDLCTKDDEDVKKYVMNINNKLDLLSEKQKYLDTYIDKYFNEEKINDDILEYIKLILMKVEEVKEQTTLLEQYTTGEYAYSIVDMLDKVLQSTTYDEIKQNLDIKLPRIPKDSDEEAKIIKDNIKKSIDKVIKICEYESTEEIKESIYNSKKYVLAILEIINIFDKKLKKYKYENDLFDFTDIAIMAINVIKENNNVREEIKNTFKEILVDEYQDTSDLQEEFISLISENNAYMVGDIKQSIYRFRNANPYIFKEKYDTYSTGVGIKIDLTKNFRSREEVLYNINEMFNVMMDDYIGGADYKESHQMVFGNSTYTKNKADHDDNMEVYEYVHSDKSYDKKEVEAFIIAKDITDKINNKYQVYDKNIDCLRDARPSDFTVLLDRSDAFLTYKKIFEYYKIPLTLYKTEKLTTEQDIIVLKNILLLAIKIYNKQLDSEFKHYYLSIARSFIHKLTDNEIHEIITSNNYKNTYIFEKTKLISSKLNKLSIKKILELIINEFDFYNKIIKLGNVESSVVRISKILDIASNLNYNPIEFGSYLENVVKNNEKIEFEASQTASDSAKIMTIHKSKGLEFNVCYYAGLYKNFNMQEAKDRFIYDNKYGIIAPYFKEGIGSTIYKDLYISNYNKEEISEKIRLFYVAVTRAKEKMIIVLPKSEDEPLQYTPLYKKLRFKNFADFLSMCKYYINTYYKDVEANLTKDYIVSNNNYLTKIKSNNEVIENRKIEIENQEVEELSFSKKINTLLTKEDINNINLGLEFHNILETLDFNNINTSFIENTFLKNKVNSFLKSEFMLDIKNKKIYQEYEFMYEDDNMYHGIIDLLIEHDDYIDIIDYKLSNIDDESYIKQLAGYKNYINKITSKEVNLYLYSILKETYKKI